MPLNKSKNEESIVWAMEGIKLTPSALIISDENDQETRFELRDIRSVQIYRHSIVKHPFWAVLISVVLIISGGMIARVYIPTLKDLANPTPYKYESVRFAGMTLATILLFIGLGLYLPYSVVTGRKWHWIKIITSNDTYDFPVSRNVNEEAEQLQRVLAEVGGRKRSQE